MNTKTLLIGSLYRLKALNVTVTTPESVFILTLIITFFLATLGRRHSKRNGEDYLANKSLNKWLVGLSAGATANSGFIVTGAVGLGYLPDTPILRELSIPNFSIP